MLPEPMEISGFCDDDEFEFIPPAKPRLWHRIIKVEFGITTFEFETRGGIMGEMKVTQGSPTYLGIMALEPSIESPFSASIK
jgi:hypothetical protein